MTYLKTLVIVLGLLIVLCLCLMGYGLYKKTENPNWRLFSEHSVHKTRLNDNPLENFTQREDIKKLTSILLKKCNIKEITTFSKYIILETNGKGHCSKLQIFDLDDLQLIGTIELAP